MEEWRIIEEFPAYEVSNMGRIRNAKTKRILKKRMRGGARGREYDEATLCSKGKSYFRYVHRLVATAFCEKPEITVKQYNLETGEFETVELELEVNHIDENKMNNNYENLEWVTHKENMNYGTRAAKAIETKAKHKKSEGSLEIFD